MDFLLILDSYFEHGRPFALLHAVLLSYFIYMARSVKRESRGLQTWNARMAGETECTRVLAQFVDESEHWGRHGILVPSTDFTDRLDSRVSGLIDGISGVVNLFLVVGVAGTFVGLFDFAQAMAKQLTEGGDATGFIGSALSSGLAKALPVSIVGIFLTIVGHLIVSRLESQLRSAVTDATQRAMDFRRKTNTSLADAIRDAMDPFKDIAKVMGEQISPVIDDFLTKVEGSMAKIGNSLEPFSKAVEQFNRSSTELSAAVGVLQGAVKVGEAHLREVQKSRENLTLRTANLLKRMESLEDVMSRAAEDLKDGAGHIREVAGGMAEAVRSSLGELKQSVGDQWSDACGQYFRALDPIRESLLASTDHLKGAGSALSDGFRGSLVDLTQTATATWTDLSGKLMINEDHRLASLNGSLLETNTKLAKAADGLISASTHANSIMANGTSMIVRQIFSEYEATLNQIQTFLREDLPPTLQTLSAVGREVRAMRDDSSSTVARLQTAVTTADRTASGFSSAVDQLSKSVRNIEYQIGALGSAVARLESAVAVAAPAETKRAKAEPKFSVWGFWRKKK